MKIESIEATPVTIPFTEPEHWSQGVRQVVTAVVVEIVTDADVAGLGESMPAPSPEVTLAAIESVKPLLVGTDPRRIHQCWQVAQCHGGFLSSPYLAHAALAGVEIAC